VREISAVLGVIVGVFFLKEPGPLTRFAGAALVAGGVMVIKVFG
jgi:drug/metabolite transporter (DMT)-like permease